VQWTSDLLSKCNPAVEHSASKHLPAISWHFQDPSQQFSFHLSTGLRPVFIICTALFSSEVSAHCFAARLSRYTSAYSLVVRYCSESSRRGYRKMKINYWRPSTTRWPSYGCRQQAKPSTSFVDYTIDLPWRNYPSPDFWTKLRRILLLCCRYPNFYNTD